MEEAVGWGASWNGIQRHCWLKRRGKRLRESNSCWFEESCFHCTSSQTSALQFKGGLSHLEAGLRPTLLHCLVCTVSKAPGTGTSEFFRTCTSVVRPPVLWWAAEEPFGQPTCLIPWLGSEGELPQQPAVAQVGLGSSAVALSEAVMLGCLSVFLPEISLCWWKLILPLGTWGYKLYS